MANLGPAVNAALAGLDVTDESGTDWPTKVGEAADTILESSKNPFGSAARLDVNAPNGVLKLDAAGKIPLAQLPVGSVGVTRIEVETVTTGGGSLVTDLSLSGHVEGEVAYLRLDVTLG